MRVLTLGRGHVREHDGEPLRPRAAVALVYAIRVTREQVVVAHERHEFLHLCVSEGLARVGLGNGDVHGVVLASHDAILSDMTGTGCPRRCIQHDIRRFPCKSAHSVPLLSVHRGAGSRVRRGGRGGAAPRLGHRACNRFP